MFLSEQVKWNEIITNKIGKYLLTDQLSNYVILKKISKSMESQSSVRSSSQNENLVNILLEDTKN